MVLSQQLCQKSIQRRERKGERLAACVGQHADVVVDQGEIVHNWRESLIEYTKLPGIRSLHDFVVVRSPTTGDARRISFSYTKDNFLHLEF